MHARNNYGSGPKPRYDKLICLLSGLLLATGENATRFDITQTTSTAATVRFVDYFPADGKPTDTAIVRFKDSTCAEQGRSALVLVCRSHG